MVVSEMNLMINLKKYVYIYIILKYLFNDILNVLLTITSVLEIFFYKNPNGSLTGIDLKLAVHQAGNYITGCQGTQYSSTSITFCNIMHTCVI